MSDGTRRARLQRGINNEARARFLPLSIAGLSASSETNYAPPQTGFSRLDRIEGTKVRKFQARESGRNGV